MEKIECRNCGIKIDENTSHNLCPDCFTKWLDNLEKEGQK